MGFSGLSFREAAAPVVVGDTWQGPLGPYLGWVELLCGVLFLVTKRGGTNGRGVGCGYLVIVVGAGLTWIRDNVCGIEKSMIEDSRERTFDQTCSRLQKNYIESSLL